MTKAQYNAILEIAENGERYSPQFLNVPARTFSSLERKGFITRYGPITLVTQEGWAAVEASQ